MIDYNFISKLNESIQDHMDIIEKKNDLIAPIQIDYNLSWGYIDF